MGTVFQLNEDGSGFRLLKIFASQTGEGYGPRAALVQAGDGTLYGTADNGGRGNMDGTIFSLVPAAMLSMGSTEQGVEVRVSGLCGRAYRIQRSTATTKEWGDLGTVTLGSSGTASLIDTNPPWPSAFYRSVQP